MALFETGPIEGKRITAEVCVHHLWYDESDYARLGTLIKCNPAIKTQADRDALQLAVRQDRIDVIATDHAPHTREEKAGSYFSAPSGLPLVQHMLPMMLELCRDGVMELPMVVQKAAHNPAMLFRIRDRGFVREGYYADLAIVDLSARTTVSPDQIRYKCGWSPLEGFEFHSDVIMTVLGGDVVYERGHLEEKPAGRPLQFY
jgi:dihydroorotase